MLRLPTPARRFRRMATVILASLTYVGVVALSSRGQDLVVTPEHHTVARHGWLYRDGEKLLLKAVGWDPARPGELPWERRRSLDLVRGDFRAIRAAGFNAIRTWEVLSSDELESAAAERLLVIQGIWLDPTGPFAAPSFVNAAVEKVRATVRATRNRREVVLYLVMNEPEPGAVLRDGVGAVQSLLRRLQAAALAEGARAPITFANWPGAEFLEERSLDVVAANLYPFRPRMLLDAIGYAGMVRLWKEQAGERPLIVSEFGVSVSPNRPRLNDAGGASEAEQAAQLPELADAIIRAGAAGATTFMWNDGWWKNANTPGDELTHDPTDGEEWFGLNAFPSVHADVGRPRPALAAIRRWNRAVLTKPLDGRAHTRDVEVELHSEEQDVAVSVSIDDGPSVNLALVSRGSWRRSVVTLPETPQGHHKLRFTLTARDGVTGIAERNLFLPGHGISLHLSSTVHGTDRVVRVVALTDEGVPARGIDIIMAATEASGQYDQSVRLRTDARGEAHADVRVPADRKTVMMVVAAVPARDGGSPLALARTFVYSDALNRAVLPGSPRPTTHATNDR